MTGTSYNGTLPLAAATTGVDGLKVIIPVAPNTSYYHYYRSNGLVRSPGGYLGEDIDVLYDFIHSGKEENRAQNNALIRDTEYANNMDRETGDYSDWWADRDYLNEMEPMKAALLMSHGFNDWNVMPEHSYRIYERAQQMGLHTQIYYHQDGHGDPPPVDMMNRWFSHYLFNANNGIEQETGAWIVREHDAQDNPTPYADFPNPNAQDVTFHLHAGTPEHGRLSLEASKEESHETLIDNFSFNGEALAKPEFTNHRLMYVSPVLEDSIHISGIPSIKLSVASSKPAANLSIWLVSLPWTERKQGKITDNIITRGWADIQNHESIWESEPLVPDEFYEIEFELQPDDQIIPSDQQIGLMIFSSDKEYTLHPDPRTELTVDLTSTTLTIPIVGGKKIFTNGLME